MSGTLLLVCFSKSLAIGCSIFSFRVVTSNAVIFLLVLRSLASAAVCAVGCTIVTANSRNCCRSAFGQHGTAVQGTNKYPGTVRKAVYHIFCTNFNRISHSTKSIFASLLSDQLYVIWEGRLDYYYWMEIPTGSNNW